MNNIKPIVGIHDKAQTLVALGKEENIWDKILSSYSDVRADPITKIIEKHVDNETAVTNNDINTMQKGDNEFNVEKNSYVAEDDGDNKVGNTFTLKNYYLLSAEIKLNDDVSKNKKDSSLYFYDIKYDQSVLNDERAKINKTNLVYLAKNDILIAPVDINKEISEKSYNK